MRKYILLSGHSRFRHIPAYMARNILRNLIICCLVAIFVYLSFVIYHCRKPIYFTQLDYVFDKSNINNKCKVTRSQLGSPSLNISKEISFKYTAKENPEVENGGRWSPKDCEPWQRVAIVIPYRDREYHLRVLLNRLHPMLRKQKAAYQVFVVEQIGQKMFNKGRLYNAGFLEINKLDEFDCFIMHIMNRQCVYSPLAGENSCWSHDHNGRKCSCSLDVVFDADVDMLPETDSNIYMCDTQGRHLSSAVNELNYRLPYHNIFGGVIALTKENYKLVNGFPNRYTGWGGEDDDMAARTIGSGLILTRPPYDIGRYMMIKHHKSTRSSAAQKDLYEWRYWWRRDGISNMAETRYEVISVEKHKLYTNISIDVGPPTPIPAYPIPKESWLWYQAFFLLCPFL